MQLITIFTSASARGPTLAPMVREVGNQNRTGEVQDAPDTPGFHPLYGMPEEGRLERVAGIEPA